MKRRNLILAVLVAAAFGFLAYLYGGHSAPTGQKPLTDLSATDFQDLRSDFSQFDSQPRMIVMLSPT